MCLFSQTLWLKVAHRCNIFMEQSHQWRETLAVKGSSDAVKSKTSWTRAALAGIRDLGGWERSSVTGAALDTSSGWKYLAAVAWICTRGAFVANMMSGTAGKLFTRSCGTVAGSRVAAAGQLWKDNLFVACDFDLCDLRRIWSSSVRNLYGGLHFWSGPDRIFGTQLPVEETFGATVWVTSEATEAVKSVLKRDFQVRILCGSSAGSRAAVTGTFMTFTGISGVAVTGFLGPKQLRKWALWPWLKPLMQPWHGSLGHGWQ